MCCCGCCCCCKFDENDPDSYCAQKRAAKQQRKLNKRIGPHLRAVENNNAVKPHYQYQAPLDLPALARLDSERRGSSLSLSRSREGSLKGAKEGNGWRAKRDKQSGYLSKIAVLSCGTETRRGTRVQPLQFPVPTNSQILPRIRFCLRLCGVHWSRVTSSGPPALVAVVSLVPACSTHHRLVLRL